MKIGNGDLISKETGEVLASWKSGEAYVKNGELRVVVSNNDYITIDREKLIKELDEWKKELKEFLSGYTMFSGKKIDFLFDGFLEKVEQSRVEEFN